MKWIVVIGLMVANSALAAEPNSRRFDASAAATDKKMILAALDLVRWHLTDPESARFRAVVISPGGKAVCGDVNSKNTMGGYAGFRRFIVTRDKVAVENDKAPFAAKEWVNRCLSDGDPVSN